MSTTEIDLAAAFPRRDYVWYGRGVAQYGEGEGFVVAGHDRRSWAALNAMVRDCDGRGLWPGLRGKVTARWTIFHETCGCTDEQHALHGAPVPEELEDDEDAHDAYRDCYEACVEIRSGLPPCGDDYAWMTDHVKPGTPGAVPILELRW